MSDGPLVSVVTPAYNEERYLRYNLASVENQEYDNVEHIVIDDGSTDGTPDILREYEDGYNLRWVSRENGGQVSAVNRGFDMADGDIVAWMNADDHFLYKDSLCKLVRGFKRTDIDVAYTDNVLVDEHNRLVRFRECIPEFSFERLMRHYFASFIFFRKSVVESNPLRDIELAMDYEYALRLADQGYTFGHIDEPIWAYRRHRETKSVQESGQQKAEGQQIRREYGRPRSIGFRLRRYIDKGAFLWYKISGIKRILEMSPTNFACEIEVDSTKELLRRQIFHI